MPTNTQLPTSNTPQSNEFRSESVQDILTQVPSKWIRYGNSLIFVLVLIIIGLSYVIKYPDIVTAPVVITTAIPPQKLVARTNGKIETILVNDKQNVLPNTPLAIIENTANYKDVFLLKNITDSINLDQNDFPFHLFTQAQLGDLESSFALFQKEMITHNLNKKLQPFQVNGIANNLEANQLRERLMLLESQKSININELELAKIDFERQQTLYNKGIIAAQELEKNKLSYLQSQKAYKSLLGTISSVKSAINELGRNSKTNQINENKENTNLERNVIQSFFQLKKAIKDWELNYVLRTSISGTVTFLQIWTANQTINSGETIFAIIPSKTSKYIGKLKAPAQNSGKIKVGQNVNIRLANYPDREFGVVNGTIKTISLTPDKDGNLLIDVALKQEINTTSKNTIKTSYNKLIDFQQEMTGDAAIVTDDLRLIERLFVQFKDVLRR